MDYVKLNPKAERCMRVNEIIKDVILLAARHMGIKRGSVHMLKMAAQMPYMEDEQAEKIAKAVI